MTAETDAAPRASWVSPWVLLRWAIALALVAWVGRLIVRQWHAVGTMPAPSPGWLAATVLLLLGYYALMNHAWLAMMRGLGASLSWSRAFRVLYLSNLAKYLPGGVWNLFGRVALCRAEGVSATATSMSLLVEIVAQCAAMAVVAMVTLSSAAAALLPIPRFLLLPGASLVLVAVHPRLVNFALGLASRWAKRPLPRFDVTYRFVLVTFLRYLAAWVLVASTFVLTARALGATIDRDAALLLVGALSVSWLVALLAFVLPGGLGLREVLLTSLLELRFGAAFAASLALGFRVGLVVLEVGAFALALALRAPRPNPHAD